MPGGNRHCFTRNQGSVSGEGGFYFFFPPGHASQKRSCYFCRMFFPEPGCHPIKYFPVATVFRAYDKPFISNATVHQRNNSACRILHFGKTVGSIHIPGKFPVSRFKQSATCFIPV